MPDDSLPHDAAARSDEATLANRLLDIIDAAFAARTIVRAHVTIAFVSRADYDQRIAQLHLDGLTVTHARTPAGHDTAWAEATASDGLAVAICLVLAGATAPQEN